MSRQDYNGWRGLPRLEVTEAEAEEIVAFLEQAIDN